jgi:streptomycin 6-kinase
VSKGPAPGCADATQARRTWLERLPALLPECAERWSLELGEPFPDATASLVVPARVPDGTDAVLKVSFPHRESECEALALARWDGDGAVRLLARDDERSALLLERCRPGKSLAEAGAETALDVFAELLPRLWVDAGAPFRPLADEAAWWTVSLRDAWETGGRPFERKLLDEALDALRELPATQGEQVLLHQDLHAGNVLSAQRKPWLAIDPKPLVGEREFGLAPIVRGRELGHSRRDVLHRLDRLSAGLGLDRERARAWTQAQTLAWAWEEGRPLEPHVEVARWLAGSS